MYQFVVFNTEDYGKDEIMGNFTEPTNNYADAVNQAIKFLVHKDGFEAERLIKTVTEANWLLNDKEEPEEFEDCKLGTLAEYLDCHEAGILLNIVGGRRFYNSVSVRRVA